MPLDTQERKDYLQSMETSLFKETEKCKQCASQMVHITYNAQGGRVCVYCELYDIMQKDQEDIGKTVAFLWKVRSCAYCGMPATDKEHVVPKSLQAGSWLVPSCRECNLLAGSACFFTFAEKREYIRNRLSKRYRKLLETPEWDSQELSEMGEGLREFLVLSTVARNIVEQRLRWTVEGFDISVTRPPLPVASYPDLD